ncbi:MAG: putative membrane protein [Candidatus Methanohalarchaeum thermophilum]|uniref:Membrane protein n=1 Tax=Methanohalarchaeum thermophilum TaxID=1903181 RepID=A0A1Q6DWY1_METT1|nr:MAG: putative membrane protein [Candidatus Methanohalarchaeum thermophilum]
MSDSKYVESLKKTALSSLLGIVAGFVAFFISKGPEGPLQRDFFGFIVIVFFIWIQQSIYPMIDIDPGDFSGKDWAYLGLMTLSFGFIVWTLILNSVY